MNWLQGVFADSDGSKNHKKHRKGENMWKKGNMLALDAKQPDLKKFPSDGDIVLSWDKGCKESRHCCRDIGIVPQTEAQTGIDGGSLTAAASIETTIHTSDAVSSEIEVMDEHGKTVLFKSSLERRAPHL